MARTAERAQLAGENNYLLLSAGLFGFLVRFL
jgi:hypothetical protein